MHIGFSCGGYHNYKEAHLPESSKVAEEFVVENYVYVKPAVLKKIDSNQYGAIPNSGTIIALLSILQSWNKATDGNAAAVRVLLLIGL
jgi:hypothetical protein